MIAKQTWTLSLLRVCAFAAFIAAMIFAVHYAGQPLIDLYNFRQTQTAITSYWMLHDGFKLAYETPVGGAPWSIPFEFPIYQAIVAGVSALLHTDLDKTGRLLSFVALGGCIIPALQIQRRLGLSKETFWVFSCLLFTAPIYVYWGRTFMIETTAMFFALASIPYFIDIIGGTPSRRSIALFAFWTSLSLLQKVTTGLPIALLLGLIWAGTLVHRGASFSSLFTTRNVTITLAAFGIPVVIGYAWTEYSSHVRGLNTLGSYLTNAKLSTWNWGTPEQRISSKLWVDVLWDRIFLRNLGGIVGLAITAFALLGPLRPQLRRLALVCVIVGLLPFFSFTNLYIIHDYYPTACVVFLIAAIAVPLGALLAAGGKQRVWGFVLLAVVAGNSIQQFRTVYLPAAKYRALLPYNQEIGLGKALRANTSTDSTILVYGYDWSSQIAYLSQRKSFTVPPWPGKLQEIWANPTPFLGNEQPGAIAVCNGVAAPSPQQIADRILDGGKWDAGRLGNCTVLVKSSAPLVVRAGDPLPANGSCTAHVNSLTGFPETEPLKSARLTVVDATVSLAERRDGNKPQVTMALVRDGMIVKVAGAIETPAFLPGNVPPRYSAMIDTSGLTGSYEVAVLDSRAASPTLCMVDNPTRLERAP